MQYFVGIISFVIFLIIQPLGIYGGDSGDLVTAGFVCGVPHPPGYPLYSLLTCFITKIPLFTVSWRASLLSSVPHALTVAIMYLLIRKITKSIVSALFGSFILLFNYVFILYGIVPEIFALNSLFISVLCYLAYLYKTTKKYNYLLILSFVFGLSLTNQHIILFLLPVVVWYLWPELNKQFKNRKNITGLLIAFFSALLIYIYVPLSASQKPIINWEYANNLQNFIRLITRSRYGTFQSGSSYGEYTNLRLLQFKAFFQFFLEDFSFIGLVLFIIGVFKLILLKTKDIILFCGGFFMYSVIYFFYASYPLRGTFDLAIFERFLLPSYLFASIIISFGIVGIIDYYKKYKFHSSFIKSITFALIIILIIFFPVINIRKTLVKFQGFRNNLTVELLADDALKNLPLKSILLLSGDTMFFGTQYVRYALQQYKHVIVLSATDINDFDYYTSVQKTFPGLNIPDKSKPDIVQNFLFLNKDKFSIFTNMPTPTPEGYSWVQYGLLSKLMGTETLPIYDTYIKENDKIWATYNLDIIKNNLSQNYSHLFLADVLNVYANSKFAYGKYLYNGNLWADAARYLNESIAISETIGLDEKYKYLGFSKYYLKDCHGALDAFEKARLNNPVSSYKYDYYESQTYDNCLHDPEKAKYYLDQYNKNKKAGESLLKDI